MNNQTSIVIHGSLLVYKNGYTPEFVQKTIKEQNLKGLRIFAHLSDERILDISFLKEYSFLQALNISSVDDYDFNFLYSLSSLKELSIFIEGKNEIDLSNQINLVDLSINWRNRKGRIKGLENCQKLWSICLKDYKEDDFTPIDKLKNLRQLTVKTAFIKSFRGLSSLSLLENIAMGNCGLLHSIHDVNGLNNLITLEFEACRKIQDYDSLSNLRSLESLTITDCKGINSIKFIRNFPSLKKLILLGDTNVLDGDMLPAKKIEFVVHAPRRHYNINIKNEYYEALIKSNLEKLKDL